MDFELRLDIAADHLRVRVAGRYSREALLALVEHVHAVSAQDGHRRMLVDMREVDGVPADLDRFDAGVRVAQVFQRGTRIAVLARPEAINRLAENAAVNRGAVMRVLSDEPEALAWLALPAP